MPTEFIWQLPTAGDSRYAHPQRERRGERASADHPFSPDVTDPRGTRFNYFDYLLQVARAADLVGFDGVRIPEDPEGDEPWIVAGYVAREVRTLKLVTEFDASRGSAVYAAKNAVSFQRFSGGRFAWQIRSVPEEARRRAASDPVGDADVLPRIEEFVTVARGVIGQAPFSFKGRFFEVLNGGFRGPLAQQKAPDVYLSGEGSEALGLSARVADVHVFDATPVETLARDIERLKALARESRREVEVGLRVAVVAREDPEEAVSEARRQWEQSAHVPGHAPPRAEGSGLWTGNAGGVTGAAAALVGSYDEVANRLRDYAGLGVASFLLSAAPHFEEAYRFGEHVLPLLRSGPAAADRRVA